MKVYARIFMMIAFIVAMATLTACSNNGTQENNNDRPSNAIDTPQIGETIEFGGHDWIVLDVQDGKALIITEQIIAEKSFVETDDINETFWIFEGWLLGTVRDMADAAEDYEFDAWIRAGYPAENFDLDFNELIDAQKLLAFDMLRDGVFDDELEYMFTDMPDYITVEYMIELLIWTHNYHNISWEISTLRQWLNNEFYNSIASADRARIAETRIANSILDFQVARAITAYTELFEIYNNQVDVTQWVSKSDTYDRIFLLSIEEVARYFGDSGQLSDFLSMDVNDQTLYPLHFIDDIYNSRRIAANTNNAGWWLRSNGWRHHMAFVGADGMVAVEGGYPISESLGVRPALWLNLQ